ncbi:hypothetical protein [Pseudonocardia endophytica]|uniref:Uncharacterized protein n=1 Tax=Pseudonocardia endophytica TaxID=401976 RepID=A0A4R1HWP9_PSEEN|nr:hypothetical protein [Pseudonocardia endophytica]TCK27174.1 hypothetical protein EV378_3036 [Pseudonocardia endophytica]
MLDPHWVFVAAALGLIGSVRYAVATLVGSARPNLVTFSLWAAAPLIGFFAQLDAGVGLPAVQTLVAGVGPSFVVVSGMVSRHGRARIGVFDVACAAVAVLALGVWLGLGQAPLAVFVAVAADAIAALPTIRKAWRDPGSENVLFYVLIGAGATVTLLTITTWEPSTWAFALYILVLCVLIIVLVVTRRYARRPRDRRH